MVYDYKLRLVIRTPRACPWEQSDFKDSKKKISISVEDDVLNTEDLFYLLKTNGISIK